MSSWGYLISIPSDKLASLLPDDNALYRLWDQEEFHTEGNVLYLYNLMRDFIYIFSEKHRKYEWFEWMDEDKRNFEAQIVMGKHPMEKLAPYFLVTPCYSNATEVQSANEWLQKIVWEDVKHVYSEYLKGYATNTNRSDEDKEEFVVTNFLSMQKMFEAFKAFYNKTASQNNAMIHSYNSFR